MKNKPMHKDCSSKFQFLWGKRDCWVLSKDLSIKKVLLLRVFWNFEIWKFWKGSILGWKIKDLKWFNCGGGSILRQKLPTDFPKHDMSTLDIRQTVQHIWFCSKLRETRTRLWPHKYKLQAPQKAGICGIRPLLQQHGVISQKLYLRVV